MTMANPVRFMLVVMLMSPAGPAHAGIEDCGGDNHTMTQCIWREFKAADAELNSVWAQVMEALRPDADSGYMPAEEQKTWRDGMIDAQRAWVTFKEADCRNAVMHEWWGGSGASAAVGACLYRHTVNRTEDLRERYLNR